MKYPSKLEKFSALFAVLAIMAFTGQNAFAQEAPKEDYDAFDQYYDEGIHDPLETMNRGIFKFNEVFDAFVMKPIAKTYVFIVPQYGRERVHNVVTNLTEPVNMLNGFIQGNPERGFKSMWRFIFNSTFGVLGIFDFAGQNLDMPVQEEDFGQTLGHYGAGHGPYIVLPFFGPSSGRDTVGRVVDIFTNPFNYVDSDAFVYGRIAVTAIDARSRNLQLLEDIYRNSVDPYATIRSAYAQRRAAQVRNNEPREARVSY